MENSKDNKQVKPEGVKNDTTKDIRSEIETVTPDTEKDGKPNDQKNNNQPKEATSDDQEKKPI